MQHKEYAVIPLLSLLGSINNAASAGASKALKEDLSKRMKQFDQKDAIQGAKAMAMCIKQHFQKRFPGSKHYRPSRVRQIQATVYINVPGVTRAYQDMDIYPRNAAWLCIPVIAKARGKSPTKFDNLFKPKDHNILAANENGKLVVYYALSKHVHQNRDASIMPSDEKLADVASKAMAKRFD